MRDKIEILGELYNDLSWSDFDKSRKAHQVDLLTEVLIDIRDTLVKLENRQGNTLIDPILGR